MKKFYFTFAITAILCTTSINAQFTSGGNIEQPKDEEKVVTKTKRDIFDRNGVQLIVALVNPRSTFGTSVPDVGSTWSKTYQGEQGFGASTGFGAYLKWFSYWAKPEAAPQLRIGNQFGFGVTINPVDWSNIGWDSDQITPIVLLECDLGPALTFNAGDIALFDLGLLLTPTLGISPGYSNSNRFDDIDSGPFFMFQTGLHLGIRGGGLSLGLDLIGGKAKYDFTVGVYDENTGYDSFEVNAELPIKTTRLSFGFTF